jgi:hypothetical protein
MNGKHCYFKRRGSGDSSRTMLRGPILFCWGKQTRCTIIVCRCCPCMSFVNNSRLTERINTFVSNQRGASFLLIIRRSLGQFCRRNNSVCKSRKSTVCRRGMLLVQQRLTSECRHDVVVVMVHTWYKQTAASALLSLCLVLL